MLGWRSSLLDAHIEHEATDSFDLVEQPAREHAKLGVLLHVDSRIETGALLLPQSGMFARTCELEVQKFTFSLEKPGPEATDLVHWKDQPGKAKHGTSVVPRVLPIDIRADVSELVEVGQIRRHHGPQIREGPRRSVGLGRRASRRSGLRLESECRYRRRTMSTPPHSHCFPNRHSRTTPRHTTAASGSI